MRDYNFLLSIHKIILLTLFKILCFGTAIIEHKLFFTSYNFTLFPKHLENK